MTVEAKTETGGISELQDYFGKEINRIGEKFEIAMKSNKQLTLDINQLNMKLERERIDNSRAIKTELQEKFKSVENQFMNEIVDLKTELAKSREEHKIEIDYMKQELMTTQRDLKQKMTYCHQKLVAKENNYSPVFLTPNDQTDRVTSETNEFENEHTSEASPKSFEIRVKRGKTGTQLPVDIQY